MWGVLCLLVELHRKWSLPAAWEAGLINRPKLYYNDIQLNIKLVHFQGHLHSASEETEFLSMVNGDFTFNITIPCSNHKYSLRFASFLLTGFISQLKGYAIYELFFIGQKATGNYC